jgi:hypothetical protein
MSEQEDKRSKTENPSSREEIVSRIRSKSEAIIQFCIQGVETNFYKAEQSLRTQIYQLACLYLELYLWYLQERFDYPGWLKTGLYYQGQLIPRTVKTIFGEVRYWRHYFLIKSGGGFYPLDAQVGLTRDGFSPLVISLATKLATRMSFAASVLVFRCFYGGSPSSEAIQHLVLGMGRETIAYMEQLEAPEGEGDVLVIEVDGKATPTATEDELKKRRGKRQPKNHLCTCPRHRNKLKRKCRCKNKRKEKGDKSKNGRSITLVVMYTLKRGEDGKLHGPLNKQVWGSYAPRKVMLAWARRQATKRGFPPETPKRIHIVLDGESCLYEGMVKLFPHASFALDIRHLEEKIWKVGRTFYKKGSTELAQWVEAKIEYLYIGKVPQLLMELKKLKLGLSSRANRDKKKREKLSDLIQYMDKRPSMMHYKKLIEEDLVIASGIVEGAARYVVGERMDCGGMRWIPERGEALLHLRCIELNGKWDHFFAWGYQRWREKMEKGEKVMIRTEEPEPLDTIDLSDSSLIDPTEDGEISEAA